MNQLIPFGTGAGAVSNNLLEIISKTTESYVRHKWFRDDSLDGLPYLLGNTTQTLMMSNNSLLLAKDFTGNFSDSLIPSFDYLVSNHTSLIRAQTSLVVTQNVILNNRLISSQGVTVSGGALLTSMSVAETIPSTNMISRICFASASVLNGFGTVCSAANMVRRPNRRLDPFGVLLNSLGAGCFWGAKYCQKMGNRNQWS